MHIIQIGFLTIYLTMEKFKILYFVTSTEKV